MNRLVTYQGLAAAQTGMPYDLRISTADPLRCCEFSSSCCLKAARRYTCDAHIWNLDHSKAIDATALMLK